MQLFHHVRSNEHRLAILRELHRVSRDTLILSVCVSGVQGQQRIWVSKEEVEAQFSDSGFSILKQYAVLPGFTHNSIYVLRKEA